MRKSNYVEVFSDRPYYIVNVIDNEVKFEELRTKTLSETISTLKRIEKMKPSEKLIACCYERYEGSFNVEVDPQEQYEHILMWGMENYKTFASKYK